MVEGKAVLELICYLGLIFSAPGIYLLSKVVARQAFYRLLPLDTIRVTYKKDGVVVGHKTIKVTGYVTDSLKDLSNRSSKGDDNG